MDLRQGLIDGIKQQSSYIEQINQAIKNDDWGRVAQLSSELATLDIAITYAEDILDSK